MANVDIVEAITLFQYSNTLRMVQSGPSVLQKLKQLYKTNEIGYKEQSLGNTVGSWIPNREGFDLQVNPTLINSLPEKQRLAVVSLIIVHEGLHAALINKDSLLDELAALKLGILYYRELSGPGIFNEYADSPNSRRRTEIVKLPPGLFEEFRKTSEYLNKDQLIDHILSIKVYRSRKYLNPKWIVDHLSLWGGLKNRWAKTKGRYIRKLAATYEPYYASVIVDIMLSIEKKSDWDAAMKKAGDLRTIQTAFESLLGDRTRMIQILELERKWNVALREPVPMR